MRRKEVKMSYMHSFLLRHEDVVGPGLINIFQKETKWHLLGGGAGRGLNKLCPGEKN